MWKLNEIQNLVSISKVLCIGDLIYLHVSSDVCATVAEQSGYTMGTI